MLNPLKLSYVIGALAGFGLVACGDDSSSAGSEEIAGSSGSAGRSGSGGRTFPGLGSGGLGGGAGRGININRQMCPMTEPSAGETCMAAGGNCMFGTRICDCITPGDTWACWDPSECPTSVPAEQSSCPVVGMTCRVAGSTMGPGGNNCSCTATGWDCGNQYCPPAEPAAGGQCEGARGSCMYGARICDCTSMAWSCWDPADCPMTPPADDSMCTAVGMSCMYQGGSCTCGMTGWRCGRGVMNDTGDAGI